MNAPFLRPAGCPHGVDPRRWRIAIRGRVNRLLDSGVISGFGARVDPVKAGWHSSAFVTLSIEQSSWQLVRARLLEIPEVEHIALVGGDYDVILLVRAHDNSELRRVVLERLQAIPEVRTTKTALIFEDFDPVRATA